MRECVCVRVREGVCVKEIERERDRERERDETGGKNSHPFSQRQEGFRKFPHPVRSQSGKNRGRCSLRGFLFFFFFGVMSFKKSPRSKFPLFGRIHFLSFPPAWWSAGNNCPGKKGLIESTIGLETVERMITP